LSVDLMKGVVKPILAGFGITARRLRHKKVTIMYPEELREQYPRTRWRHFLTRYDSGLEKCIGCSHEINMIRCIFCGYCQEACPTGAIVLRKNFELADYKREDFIYTKEMLLEKYPGQNLEPFKGEYAEKPAPVFTGN
jgi:NADH-quinone oxidoreductase subunit I